MYVQTLFESKHWVSLDQYCLYVIILHMYIMNENNLGLLEV